MPRSTDALALDGDAYWSLLSASGLAVVIHGADGAVVQANRAFAELLGYSLDEALQLSADRVIHPDDRPVRDAQAGDMFAGLSTGGVVHRRLMRRDGSTIRARVRKSVVRRAGVPLVLTIIEEWGPIGELEHDVRHDQLTGLLNRRGMRELARLTYPFRPTFLAMADVDQLKSFNDAYGHAIGDAVLAAIGAALARVAAPGALVARWSGDEFVVCAPPSDECPDPTALTRIVEECVGRPLMVSDLPVSIVPRISVGATVFDPTVEELDEALKRADRVMYTRKRRGTTTPDGRNGSDLPA
ncbi:sensor domain-containing diguanylate cyclase [Tsukamurella sp. 8F]|uniref:sensor domain-containing diguanylate cyclase n=1 Tax=unclassified Tsukamurella TaxID=2633480 RepID=UPI0023B8B772|nr:MULTISPECIES: sensor domain-containing diguanylate cyclase [unclassified Tsukamurella]MDF0529725.1 sensor domain-containing diguanylate cyclase [Tsukamurella sp. 8J]MDF0586010.1 sensor domain-containing diguanylate cyclase [Tsukamurella sp. 8F]